MRPLFILFFLFSFVNCLIIREFPPQIADEELQELTKHRPKSRFGTYIDDPRANYGQYGLTYIDEIPDKSSDDSSNDDEVLSDEETALTSPLSSRSEFVNGVACHMCNPGFGLVSFCTVEAETVCEPCVEGFNFSDSMPHFKPCTPCSRCGQGMYTEVPCTSETDTFCDSCQAARQTMGTEDDSVINPMLQNLEFLRDCLNLPHERRKTPMETDALLDAIEAEILENFEKDNQQESSSSSESSEKSVYDTDFNAADGDVPTSSTTVQPTMIVRRLVSYPPNDVFLDNDGDRQLKTTTTTRRLADLVAIDAVPRRAQDDDAQMEPKPSVVAGAALPDKVSSSQMGGFEGQLLPEPLQLAETNFGRAPMLKKPLLKKIVAVRYPGTKKPSVRETVSPNSLHLETEDVDETLFIFDWLTGYDDEIKHQSTDQISNSPKGIIFKPSNHNYPYIRLVHSSDMLAFIRRQQRRLVAAALLVLVVFTIVAALLVLRCKRLRRQRRQARLVWASGLTELDDKIIKECAQKMTQAHKVPRGKFYRRNPFNDSGFECDPRNDKSDPCLIDNPLVHYLEHEDNMEEDGDCSFNASTEHLVAKDDKKSKSSTVAFV